MNFAECMATNPPRLVVLFQRGPGGEEQFQWGVVGSIPILSLVGNIAAVQAALIGMEWIPECTHDVPALVLAWDEGSRGMNHFVHDDIPNLPLVGMLETIKIALVGSRMGQHVVAQQVAILGPDGRPMRG